MSDTRDRVDVELAAMFHRREADVLAPARLPAAVRHEVRRRQVARGIVAAVAALLLALGSLGALRATLERLHTPAQGTATPEPTYAPSEASLPPAAGWVTAGSGETAATRWRVAGMGDPAHGVVRTQLQLASPAGGPWSSSAYGPTLHDLGDPLVHRVYGLRLGGGRRLNVLWGFFVLGVDEVRVDLRGCPPVRLHRDDAVDVGPDGVAMSMWVVASRCMPIRISASTILGGDLGTQRIPAAFPTGPS